MVVVKIERLMQDQLAVSWLDLPQAPENLSPEWALTHDSLAAHGIRRVHFGAWDDAVLHADLVVLGHHASGGQTGLVVPAGWRDLLTDPSDSAVGRHLA